MCAPAGESPGLSSSPGRLAAPFRVHLHKSTRQVCAAPKKLSRDYWSRLQFDFQMRSVEWLFLNFELM